MSTTETNTEDWRRALGRFEAIGELPADERAAALAALATEDPALHRRVVRLLGADRAADDAAFLAAPEDSGGPLGVDTADLTGRAIGPWSIVRELGAGGMGRVWLAKRSDGRYEGLAAIKLPKAALADRGAAERFAREGRILGSLGHPHIARLLDAGTLEAQPYLVLEYIEGERIDAWSDAKHLGLRERVKLFAEVCEAVAYAHANLVVHRDLKPSNILVTPAGEVKLLDFGIAKLLDGEFAAAEETEITQAAGRALTPDYAAPEQVSGAPVTTATDVYSLGVVLYKLLSGRSPYERNDGSRPSAFELQRAVLEAEPRRLPSTTGDLENIVAKALKKSPAERYPSASALRDDLRRYLENRPVEARGDSARYVAAKFVRRHRIAVAAGAVVLLALAAGVGGVAWQAKIAREEGVRARVQADKAKAVSDFMAGIFNANSTQNPDPAKARATTARELLDIGRQRAAKDLAANPEAHQEVLLLLGKLYYQLTLPSDAAPLDRERIAILRKLDNGGGTRLAQALFNLGGTLMLAGDMKGSGESMREALEVLDAAGDRTSITRGEVLGGYATTQRYIDPRKGLELQRAAAHFETYFPRDRRYLSVLRALANELSDRGMPEEAEVVIGKAIAAVPHAEGVDQHIAAYLHQVSGVVSSVLQKPVRARDETLRALEIDERVIGAGSAIRPYLEANLGRFSEPGPDWKPAIARLQAFAASLDPQVVALQRPAMFVQGTLAQIYMRTGDIPAARASLAAALPTYRKSLPKPMLANILAVGAELELLAGNEAAARAFFEELQALRQGVLADNLTAAERTDDIEARLLLARREAAAARTLLAARLEAIAKAQPQAAGNLLRRSSLQLLMAEAEQMDGAVPQAEKRARDLLAAVEARPDREWFAHVESAAALRLASTLSAQGRDADARPLRERAARLLAERQVPSSPRLALK